MTEPNIEQRPQPDQDTLLSAADTVAPELNGSHEQIEPVPHGHESVDGTPGYTRNTPLTDVAPTLLQRGVPEPHEVDVVPPKAEDRGDSDPKKRSPWLLPSIGGGVAVLAAIAAFAVPRGGVSTPAEGGPGASATSSPLESDPTDPADFTDEQKRLAGLRLERVTGPLTPDSIQNVVTALLDNTIYVEEVSGMKTYKTTYGTTPVSTEDALRATFAEVAPGDFGNDTPAVDQYRTTAQQRGALHDEDRFSYVRSMTVEAVDDFHVDMDTGTVSVHVLNTYHTSHGAVDSTHPYGILDSVQVDETLTLKQQSVTFTDGSSATLDLIDSKTINSYNTVPDTSVPEAAAH